MLRLAKCLSCRLPSKLSYDSRMLGKLCSPPCTWLIWATSNMKDSLLCAASLIICLRELYCLTIDSGMFSTTSTSCSTLFIFTSCTTDSGCYRACRMLLPSRRCVDLSRNSHGSSYGSFDLLLSLVFLKLML